MEVLILVLVHVKYHTPFIFQIRFNFSVKVNGILSVEIFG